MEFKDLSDELKQKAAACTSTEELVALAQAEGIELTDEQLESLSGGVDWACSPHDCDPNF